MIINEFSASIFYAGLDYTCVESLMNITQIAPDERLTVLDDIRVMERAALQVLNKR